MYEAWRILVAAPVALAIVHGVAVADDVPGWLRGKETGPHPIKVLRVDSAGRVYGVARFGTIVWPSWWDVVDLSPPRSVGAACAYERALAEAATRSARALLAGRSVTLVDIRATRGDGLSGTLILADGRTLSEALVSVGLAHRHGGERLDPWCGW